MVKKTLIYNLTAHFVRHPDVEFEPRVEVMVDPRSHIDVIAAAKEIAKRVPRGSTVLLGGHSQIVGIMMQIAKIKKWKVVFYSTYDNKLYNAA